jgi:hypothetical protein
MSFNDADILVNTIDIIKQFTIQIDLHQSDILTANTDTYYGISYGGGINFTLNLPTKQTYSPTKGGNIYLFGKIIHNNITGYTDFNGKYAKDLIGELVISTSDSSGKNAYLCFFISQVNSKAGNATDQSLTNIYNNIIIDSTTKNVVYSPVNATNNNNHIIIQPITDGTIPINQNNDGIIVYNDATNNSIVIVYLNPITVSNTKLITFISSLSSTTLPSPFISNYPSGGNSDIYTLKPGSASTTADTSAATAAIAAANPTSEDQIYIECTPTGSSGDQTPNINIPLSSDIMKDIQNSSFAQLCTNMSLFCLILFICYISIPTIYKMAVIQKMEESDKGNAVYFIMLFIFIVMLGLGMDFKKTHDVNELTIALFLLFLNLLIFILTLSQEDSVPSFNLYSFLVFVSGVFGNWLFTGKILIFWGFLIAVTSAILFSLTRIKKKDGTYVIDIAKMNNILLWVSLTIIPVLVGIILWIFKPLKN